MSVVRLAYRQCGEQNRYVADGVLNLPAERASHGVRCLAAICSAAGSFEHATGQVRDRTGLGLGTRQVEQLAVRAAGDFDAFYAEQAISDRPGDHDQVLVLSADGKGIVMRSDALRSGTAQAAQRASPKLKTRLSRGEKANRKRIAEIGAVYDIQPAPRSATDVLAATAEKTTKPPRAQNKWLCASVIEDAASVIEDILDEAQRRDGEHQRTWVALVDGNRHQIDRITAEAKQRDVQVAVVVDFVHVLEYLWSAAWCFFDEGDPAAEAWVSEKALAVLDGKAGIVAASIRRTATKRNLPPAKRRNADRAAAYLLNKKRYLDYPLALQNGWPIATGVIEGACRHLVKDRLDITGARWELQGAEAILKLRALISTATSTPTGSITLLTNATATTTRATPTASSPAVPDDDPPDELHPKSNQVIAELGPEIRWLTSYVTDDKMYCLYVALDEDILVEHARCAGFPANPIEKVESIIDPSTAG